MHKGHNAHQITSQYRSGLNVSHAEYYVVLVYMPAVQFSSDQSLDRVGRREDMMGDFGAGGHCEQF